MIRVKAVALGTLLVAASISNSAFADQCTLSDVALTVSPENAYQGDSLTVAYSANRTSCAGVGSFSHKVRIGGEKGAELGSCEGVRTVGVESCTGQMPLPANFTGEINIWVNGASRTIKVVQKPVRPVVTPKSGITAEDEPLEFELAVDGEIFSKYELVLVPEPDEGTATIDGSKLVFTPAKDWAGTAVFSYRAYDENGRFSDSEDITVEVTPEADAPILLQTSLVGIEDQPLTFKPKVVDPDEGDSYNLVVVGQVDPTVGAVVADGDTVTFTPAANWYGEATFTIKAVDSFGLESYPQAYTVLIENVNDNPIVTAQANTLLEDGVFTSTAIYTDPDGEAPYRVWVNQQAVGGRCSVSGEEVTFTPVQDWNGVAVCQIAVGDSSGGVGLADFTYTVTAVNDAPAAEGIQLTLNQGESRTLAVSVTDPDEGDEHSLVLLDPADSSFGSVSVSGTSVTITPAASFFGTRKISLQVTDTEGAKSEDFFVYVKVLPVNGAPVLAGQTFVVQKNDNFTVQIGAIDPNRDSPLTYSIQTQPQASQGVVTIAGDMLTFKPVAGFIGTATATVTATDPGGLTSVPATYMFQVQDVQLIAYDPDIPDSHTLVIVEQPAASVGTLSVTGSKLTLQPVKGYFGTATFKYKVVDSAGAESPITSGSIIVNKHNYAPSSSSAAISVLEGEASVPVTPTVVDENPYDAGKHTFIVPVQDTKGFIEVVNNQLVYTAPFGFSGYEKFKYLAVDQGGLSVVGEATVTVTPVNVAPTFVGGKAEGLEGESIDLTLQVKDKNPGDTFTLSVLENPASGTLTLNGSVLTFTAEPGFIGSQRVPVRAVDQGGLSVDGYALFTVNRANFPPTNLSGQIKLFENGVSAPYYPKIADQNSYDYGKHILEVVTPPVNGTVALVENRLVYTPADGFTGSDSIEVKATDLAGASVVGTVAVVVDRLNTAPLGATMTIYTLEGEASPPAVPAVDDPNGWDTFTYEVVAQPKYGSVVLTEEGFVYTPKEKFFGTDEFVYRVVDEGGEYLEETAKVSVAKKNYAPTGLLPADATYYAGVGRTIKVTAQDPNVWGYHEFSVVTQPEHGEIWFDGNNMVYRTTGDTPTSVVVRITDQDGLTFDGTILLNPRPVSDLVEGLPVIDLPTGNISTPAITAAFDRPNGKPGFMVEDPDALAALGTDLVVILDETSEVGLRLAGKELLPNTGGRFTMDYLSSTGIGASLAALEATKAGQAFVKVARLDSTGSVYRIPVKVWSPAADIKFSANPALQLIDRVRGELVASSPECKFSVSTQLASKANPYDSPLCFVEFTKRPMEAKLILSDSSLAFQGPVETAGTQDVSAEAFILGPNGGKHLVAQYTSALEVLPVDGAVTMGPKYPFAEAYVKVEELDVDFRQETGPTCDLSVVEYRAKSSAASYSTRPVCFVEWTEIPIGLSARANWEKPYLLGNSNFLGANSIKWSISIFSPNGTKHLIGNGKFDFQSVEPPAIAFEYQSKSNKLTDTLFSSSTAGQYVGEALVTSASAKMTLAHQFNEGKDETEQLAPGYSRDQTIQRRIYVAPFTSVWQKRTLSATASYTQISDSAVASTLDVVSVPDQSVLPIIDGSNQKILSTEELEVSVSMGDSYNTSNLYNATMMGEWDIRLVTKPTWDTVEPLTNWVRNDAEGSSAFTLSLEDLAGKSLRIFAEARPVSPIPEYQVTRMSPRPLSIAILNGAALDGSIRALRLTGEAPLRVTLFADVTNKAWTRDLGAVNWEMSTDGGAWQPLVNPSKTAQRLATTFQKGSYRIRAELINKNSGAKSMTDEIEIVAYNVPQGSLKGPGNTFLDANADFRVRDLAGKPIDLSNIDVEWSLDRGVTWESGVDTMSMTRSTEQRVYVYARMKYKDSPTEDPRIWKVLRGGVAFRKVRPPRVQLIGPRRPEVGVEAKWVANMLMPYPNMDLTMNGEFIMPKDGGIVPGQEATYTPTEDDLALEKTEIQYRAWIEGYRDRGGEGITSQRITFWLYDWPEWAIQPTMSSEYAPADLTLRVRNVGEFKGVEGVYYDWELPAMPGYTIVKDDNMSLRLLTIEAPETYPFKVHVYDARGNYSLVEKQMVFREPPPWAIRLEWSGDNTAQRAPLGVMIRPYISGGHPKDSITSMIYSLDGKELATGGSRYARAQLPAEGDYKFKLNIETKMGKASQGEVAVEVRENVAPTCELEVKEGGTAWTANARCVDTDGRIARHQWYVNDKLQGLGGSVITISKRTYPEAPRIILVAVDDSGEESPPIAW